MTGTVLILGGTEEARLLATRLAPHCPVITSLAGRTAKPRALPGQVRIGGFGGVDGLVAYLKERAITALVDATHPYAARMGVNAVQAAQITGIPCLRLDRPAWEAGEGDQWTYFPDAKALAAVLPSLGQRIFLSLGGADLAAFETVQGVSLLIRAIDPPDALQGHPDVAVLLARGPFDFDAERELLSARAIDLVVSRNAGGSATWPKILAARALGIPVAMIDRPARPDGARVTSVDDAVTWVLEKEAKR